MNKNKFIELVENPGSVRPKDADILAELARNYPYSSLVHTLLAKALQNSEHAKASLATAALYIPDRSVLKSVIENNKEGQQSEPGPPKSSWQPEASPEIARQAQEKVISAVQIQSAEEEVESRQSVVDELEENLLKLREQRKRFEAQDGEQEPKQEKKAEDEGVEKTPAANEERGQQILPERLQELIDNKEEREINDPKRIEQINLIDSFIRNSSSISKKYRSLDDPEVEQSDLTGDYHFTPHDLVTENLALIMVRQGKKDKAIDIYEKLVLKYPQKKAYFASCIEKLKTPDK